jgi:hypothetical protein
MRSEDDLRAAFTDRAADAPAAEDVARAVRREVSKPPRPRRWLAPAVAVAAAAAVGVPLALAISHSSNSSSKKADSGGRASSVPRSAAGGAGAGSANEGSAGGASSAAAKPRVPGPNPGAASLPLCSPDDVSVSVRRDGAAGALLVTSRGPACRIARVPSLRWPSGSTTVGTQQDTNHDKVNPASFGVLPPDSTASGTVQWTGCGLPDGTVVYVDWGDGPVAVNVAAASAPTTCTTTPAPTKSVLRVSPLSGLS